MASNQVELNVNVLSTAQSSRSRKQKSRGAGTARPKTASQAYRASGKGSPRRRSPKKIDRVTVAECQAKLAKVCGAGGDIEAVRAAFTKFLRFGRSKTGDSLTFEEFIVAAKHCGIMEVEQDYAMFQLMDVNGDGIISFKEFAKILYGHNAEVLNWTYHKANKRLAKTRVEQQQSRIIKTGMRLRQRLQERAAHVKHGEDGPLRGIEVGARVDISSAKNIMRRYGIQHTEAALAELLEYMNPEHSDTILYEDFVTRIFTEPQVHRGVSPPKPDRVLKLPSPQRSPATSPSRSSHNNTLNVPVAHDEHGSSSARPSPSPQDATPALKMLRDSLTAQVGRGSSGVGKLLKTFTKFRQNAGAKGKFITFEDFKVALWRSGIRLPADKARDVFYLVDTDQSGTIEYEEFISALFGEEASKGLGISPTLGDGYARQQQHIRSTLANKQSTQFKDADEILAVMIEKAREDGGANSAYIHFKHASQAHNGLLDLETFRHALRATGINAAPDAAESLFRRLDTSGDGAISYQEFVGGVVGDDTMLSGQHMANIRADWKQRRLQREAQLRQRSSEVVARRFSSEEDPIDVLRDYLDRKLNKHNVLISFKRFRRDSGASSGNAITRPEFAKLLRICGLEDLSDDAVAEQFARIDMNGDGFISYNEFCARLFDPEHEIPRKSGGRQHRRRAKKGPQQLPTLSPNARHHGDGTTEDSESRAPMSLGELAHVVRGHLLDHPKRLDMLLAAASTSGLQRRGFLAVSASELMTALQAVREVRLHYGPVTPEALGELEVAVAQHSSSGRSVAGTGILDLRDLVSYLYRVSATQDRSSGREPDRVARFDLQQKAKRLEKKIAAVDGRGGHENTSAQQPTDIERLLEEFRTQFRDTQRSAKAPELRKRAFEDAFRRFRAAGSGSGSAASPPSTASNSTSSGRVDLMQFRTAIFRSGLYLSRQACQELFHHFDRNGDGFVDSAEFIQAVFPADDLSRSGQGQAAEPSQQNAQSHDGNALSNKSTATASATSTSGQTEAKRSAEAVLARRSRTSGSSASSDPAEISKQLDLVRQAAQARFMMKGGGAGEVTGAPGDAAAAAAAAAAASFKNFLVFVGSASAAEGAATGRDDTGAQVLFVEIPFSAEKARQLLTRLKPRVLVRTLRSEVVAQLLQTLAPNGFVSQSSFSDFLMGGSAERRRPRLGEGRRRSTERRSSKKDTKTVKARQPPATAEELFVKLRAHILRQSSSLRFFSGFKTYGAGDGASIDLASFRDGLQLKPDLRGASPAIVRELFEILDLNGNGNIELDEFVKCMVADAVFENLRSRHLRKSGQSVDAGGLSPATGGRSSVPSLDLVDRRQKNLQRPRAKSAYQRRDVGIALRHAFARSSSQRR